MNDLQFCVHLPSLRLYGYHGLHGIEAKIGAWFTFGIKVWHAAGIYVGYDVLHRIIAQQNATPTPLLETLLQQMLADVLAHNPALEVVELTATKQNPAFGIGNPAPEVTLKWQRPQTA